MPRPTSRRVIPQDSLAGAIASPGGPRVYAHRDARVDGLDALMEELRRERPLLRVTRTAVLVKAVASLLSSGAHRGLNARVGDGEVLYFSEVNLAVPVYTHGGRVAAVLIDDAAGRPLEEIASALSSPSETLDLSEATFGLVNLGPFGLDVGLGIYVPGPVATLTIGRTRPLEGQEGAGGGRLMGLTLAVDPRAVGPDEVGSFLADLSAALSSPAALKQLMSA